MQGKEEWEREGGRKAEERKWGERKGGERKGESFLCIFLTYIKTCNNAATLKIKHIGRL